eukprot:Em0020g410a
MYTAVIVVCCAPSSLLSEIADVIGDRKEVTADDVDKLKYTEQVIQEVLRMYPPASMMIKESPKGGVTLCSIYVPEGTPMSFVTSLMCRNPEYFNYPDTFDPSRFDAEKTCVGHRSCIGRHFAMIEAKVILANLQSDTASFIQAGGGTVEYPTTKGQYCLHSSGNCSLKQ